VSSARRQRYAADERWTDAAAAAAAAAAAGAKFDTVDE